MQIFHCTKSLQKELSTASVNRKKIAFVPTMGNLHEGHLDLVRAAKNIADIVVISIFVNPLQFGGDRDFDIYPRTLESDCEKLRPLDVQIVYSPHTKEIYPQALESMTKVIVPKWSNILCGAYREGHFEGVTTVVAKLLNIVAPDVVFFGEKDFQQLQIIRKMVLDLNMPIDIQAIATRREADGLAMSSRNQYLNTEERKTAPILYQILNDIKQSILTGSEDFRGLEKSAKDKLIKAGFKPDYVSLLDSGELQPAEINSQHIRVFSAAYLGKARLIDNLEIRLT